MKKEYEVLKIQKFDTRETNRIKIRGNKTKKEIDENCVRALASGFLGGVAFTLFFATMKSCRDDAYVGKIVAEATGTVLASLGAVVLGAVSKYSQNKVQDSVQEMSDELIEREEAQQLRLKSKNSIDKVLRGE